MIGLEKDDKPEFDSIVVISDRLILDKQLHNTIKQFAQAKETMGHTERASDLRDFIKSGEDHYLNVPC